MMPLTHSRRPSSPSPGLRPGITLLEVLVACGILVVGLASLASIMPAAGSRLAQASVEDRAGATAANAYADILTRGLASSGVFSDVGKACFFGAGLDVTGTMFQANGIPATSIAGPKASLFTDLDPARGFSSEDELVYVVSGTSDTPVNQFLSNNLGPREFRPGVCWGALLAPAAVPAAPGSDATLSIAVFSKPGDSRLLVLQNGPTSSPLFRYATSRSAAEDEQDRKTLLPGCSFVLALPLAAGNPPRFLKITSSWTNPGPGSIEDTSKRQSFVVLDLDPIAGSRDKYVKSSSDGSTGELNVIAFENLVRVDHHTLSLE